MPLPTGEAESQRSAPSAGTVLTITICPVGDPVHMMGQQYEVRAMSEAGLIYHDSTLGYTRSLELLRDFIARLLSVPENAKPQV